MNNAAGWLRRPGALLGGRDERRWLVGLALVTGCSWGRWLAAGSLKVDESYPSELAGSLLALLVLCGLGLMVLGWRGLLAGPPRAPRRLAYVGLAVASLMLPMLSNDVFSLFTYGSLAARGRDVYSTTAFLGESGWSSWVGERWSAAVCVYGPMTLIGTLPSALAGLHPFVALLVLRLAWLAPLVVVMEWSMRRFADRPFFHAMVWLNPLFLIEGAGQLHADLLGLVAVTAGVLAQTGSRGGDGGARRGAWLYALAVLGKYSFVFAGPWFWLTGAATSRQRALRLPAMAAAVLVVGALLFAPFWRGPATLTVPLHTLSSQNPGGSITEILGDVILFLRSGHIRPPDMPVQAAMALDRATQASMWMALSVVMRVVALVVALRLLAAMLRKPQDQATVALGTGALVVAAITLASHRFQSWYLLAALPFFGLHCTPAWQKWWVAVAGFSIATNVVHVLPTSAHLLPVISGVSNAGTILAFVFAFRARYFRVGAPPVLAGPGEPLAERLSLAPGEPSGSV